MALVILHADPSRGGAEGYTVDLAHALARRGLEPTLIAATFGAAARGLTQIKVGDAGLTRRARYRAFVESVDRHLAEARYDVVHAIAPVRRCDLYHPQAGLAAEAIARGHLKYDGIRRPLDRLATRLNPKRQFVGAVERELLTGPRPARLLCVSAMVRQTARDHYALPEERMTVLFNAIDPARFDPDLRPDAGRKVRERFGIAQDKVVALIVAQDFKRKGVRPAIEAVARLGDERVELLVVGKPDPAPYKALVESLGVSQQVIFAGPTADAYAFYRAADLFVLPTHHDPCSLVVLEALAMGVPVITTRANGAHEIMSEGVHGYVLDDAADVAGLRDRLGRMLDEAHRKACAAACLELRPKLSRERHLDQLVSIYENVAREKGPTAGGTC
ncbi:MAG: glycosyltransferase family 4 protein [Tepidisphaeraceae bacterium]